MFFLLSLFFCAVFGQAFQCSFSYTQNTGAIITGKLGYDYDSGCLQRDIRDSSGNRIVTEFYKYDSVTKAGEYVITRNRVNSRCGRERLNGVMPNINFGDASCHIGNDRYILTNCEYTGALHPPVAPDAAHPCPACRAPLDVVFAVDTSLSVCTSVDEMARTLRDLTASYQLGPNQVRVGIVRFNWRSWVSSPLSSGTALNRITFPSDWPSDCGTLGNNCRTPGVPNNCLGSCLSCGVRMATQHLQTEGRPNAAKVIIIFTDGYHNMQWVTTDAANGAHGTYGSALCPVSRPPVNRPGRLEKYEACHDDMLRDMAAARQFATQTLHGVQIFSYGQYTTREAEDEFLTHTITRPNNAFISTTGWIAVRQQTSALARQVCRISGGPVEDKCPGCVGFCSLGECIPIIGGSALSSANDNDAVNENTDSTDSDATTTTTTVNGDSTTTTTTYFGASENVPGWGVALLALVAILIVCVIVLIGFAMTKSGTERV